MVKAGVRERTRVKAGVRERARVTAGGEKRIREGRFENGDETVIKT
jgi:hypothetical protein